MKRTCLLILIVYSTQLLAQSIKGSVGELTKENKLQPIAGANVYWANTTEGTATNAEGQFELKISGQSRKLVISYIGYQNDTITLSDYSKPVHIVLTRNRELPEVVIQELQPGSYISRMKPIKTEVITTAGLHKAACCNLSESFVNSATVDVAYSDAVTGAKQIQMLGLAGVYSQIQAENIPAVRGLATPFGLLYIPGSWMESIQISKGTSSVKNGYESITGQINVEYKKPEEAEKLFVNLYGNDEERGEANVYSSVHLSDKWSTMILLHGEKMGKSHDKNNDGFLDMPKMEQYHLFYRLDRNSGDWESKTGIKVMEETRQSGSHHFDGNFDNPVEKNYGVQVNTRRYEAFTKNGIIFNDGNNSSIGTIFSVNRHLQSSIYGRNRYEAAQNSFYTNLMFQSELGTPSHAYTVGFSLLYDEYNETLNQLNSPTTERVPGVFLEYTFSYEDKLKILAGFRYDYHNLYKDFYTPRLHVKYSFSHHTTLRLSAGKGYRSPRLIAENSSLLMSSRQWMITESPKAEEAWNFGASLSQDVHIAGKELEFNLDYFRTEFVSQLIADIDVAPGYVYFYNLRGNSFSNSAQADVKIEPVEQLEVNLAVRWNDVRVRFLTGEKPKPLVSPVKALVSLSYATKFEKWKFDFTAHYNSKARIPTTEGNPEWAKTPEYSPDYWLFYGQITRKFKHFDFYAGAENIFDFTQKTAILDSHNPFGNYFDATLIWGPIYGRMIYAGLRYHL